MPTFTQSLTVTANPATATFTVSNGNILTPEGNGFIARGIAINPNQATAAQALALFPGVNFVRLPIIDYANTPASVIDSMVTDFTSNKIVMEIENHPYPLIPANTGTALTNETAWYQALAQHYADNPYVWFGTLNEPQGPNGSAISAEQLAIYNAIRNAGNNTILMMEAGLGGGDPGNTGAGYLTSASYTNMHNVVWDQHFYGWVNNQQSILTGPNGLEDILAGFADVSQTGQGRTQDNTGVHALQEITSADGIIPVINGEFGNSTDGQSVDANADDVISTVTQWAVNNGYTRGFCAWHWNTGPQDKLTSSNTTLTPYGQQIAAAIKTLAGL